MTLPEMQILPHIDLNTAEARTLTQQIKTSMADLMMLVVKAWVGRIWIALDYPTWNDWIKNEFNHAPLSLPRDERRAVVTLLRGQGMSTRAIGAAAGVTGETISKDLAGVRNLTPDIEDAVPVVGLDGKNYRVTCDQPEPTNVVQPAPQQTVTCPTCGGTGKVTQ